MGRRKAPSLGSILRKVKSGANKGERLGKKLDKLLLPKKGKWQY